MRIRKLVLRSERLTSLSTSELGQVQGGDDISLVPCLRDKLEDMFDTLQATRCFCP